MIGNKYIEHLYSYKPNFIIWLIVAIVISSCSGTKYIAEDEHLLNRNTINLESEEIEKKDFKKYFRQSPNRRILGFKFHLFLYNLANPEKEKFPHGWLKRIGEPPVIYDEELNEKTKEQFKIFLENKGYYYSSVSDTTQLKKQKANVDFFISTGDPYLIDEIHYEFEDTSIRSLVLSDTVNTLIRSGDLFDKEILENERNRIEMFMRDNGYYRFRNDFNYIQFEAKRIGNSFKLILIVKFLQSRTGYVDPISKVRRHQKYIIDNVLIIPNMDLLNEDSTQIDTVYFDNFSLLYAGKMFIKPQTITSAIKCKPNRIYRLSDVNTTTKKLTSLELFKLVNITFSENSSSATGPYNYGKLDCIIEMKPRERMSRKILVDGTVAERDLGISASYTYNNYNLLKGAEKFSLKLSGAIEAVERFQQEGQELEPMREFSIASSVDFPKFLLPIRAEEFTAKYDPKTNIQLSYNYQDRPDYLRTIFNSSYGYHWRGNKYIRHWVSPVDFNYVRLDSIKDLDFWEDIKDTPLKNSFTSHTILGSRYGFEYTTQVIEKLRNYVYFKYNVETAGFMTNTLKSTGEWAGTDSTLLGVKFYQYIKSDVDIRQNFRLLEGNRLVYRIFLGAGYPYGASTNLPFEKMYYSGGPYSIRAWQTRTLGPGSDTTQYGNYANKLGDMRIEANIEYRFDMFWKLEGALFLDAGNIWLIRNFESRPEAGFKFNKFYKEFALGSGVGVRVDLGFFLVRFDFGFKMRDPAVQSEDKWVFNKPETKEPVVFQFGIDYPF